MKRITTLFLTALLLLSLIACGAKDAWQEQYDLGMRYLNDGSYEEAVIAFTAAIEIDPKRSEAYLGAAEAYIAADDIDAAIAILEKGYAATNDDTLKNRLDEIKSGTFSDYLGRTRRESHYDGNGVLTCWYDYEYNDPENNRRRTGITSYDPNGEEIQHLEFKNNEQGKCVYGLSSWDEDGKMIGATYTYDDQGRCVKFVTDLNYMSTFSYDADGKKIQTDNYDPNGALTGYATSEYGDGYKRDNLYNAEGMLTGYQIQYYNQREQRVRYEHYDADGTLTSYSTEEYDDNGKRIAWNHYDAEGNLTSRDVYS